MTLAELNALPVAKAQETLLACCGSRRWAERMTGLRPFASRDVLLRDADVVARELSPSDWLEAFAAHPRIGERSASAWSRAEQAAALSAGQDLQAAIARANAEYEAKFGFIFIVFASGKSPEQILQLMEERMQNDRDTEIGNAAGEQRQITRSRLLKLLES